MKYKIALFAILTITLFAVYPVADRVEAGSSIYTDSLTFTADDFVFETVKETVVSTLNTSIYTSSPIQSPIPFNVIFPSWTTIDKKDNVRLHIRTSKTGQSWSDWQYTPVNHDWTLPDDPDLVGDMILVTAVDEKHQWVQYRLEQETTDSKIQTLLFTFIDSTAGSTAEEMLSQQANINANKSAQATNSYPKPTVISRDVWCQHSDCNYTEGLEYSPVTHLIVHHTASSNYSLDYNWPAVVRAVWRFHAHDREWGDIGYNYLVDPNGVLYEGHLGGDDVIGTHTGGANAGGMAISFMGNFSSFTPYDAMLNSAIELLAWKADQENINVFDASSMPYMDWGLPNLMGHRDAYGGTNTACPGEDLHELIPYLQEQVAAAIEFDDPAIYVNEINSAFKMSDPDLYWHSSPRGCGHQRHGYYTFSVTNPGSSTNWGSWALDVPVNGRYQLDAYIPFCTTGESETDGAVYGIDHAHGHDAVTISQNDEVGLWVSLGEYDLSAGTDGLVRLTDLTNTDEGRSVWFDSLRLVRVGDGNFKTSAVNSTPADNSWATSQSVQFEWAFVDPDNITTITLQAATDAAFTDIIEETQWETAVYSHTLIFTQDYAPLYWRVQLKLADGQQIASDATTINIDSTPPTSTISTLHQFSSGNYVITLEGADVHASIEYYNVDYREVGESEWTSLISNTTDNRVHFTPPVITQTYELRSQAVDSFGNIEPPHAQPDIITDDAVMMVNEIFLPIVVK